MKIYVALFHNDRAAEVSALEMVLCFISNKVFVKCVDPFHQVKSKRDKKKEVRAREIRPNGCYFLNVEFALITILII